MTTHDNYPYQNTSDFIGFLFNRPLDFKTSILMKQEKKNILKLSEHNDVLLKFNAVNDDLYDL
jgi:hypothetical protein